MARLVLTSHLARHGLRTRWEVGGSTVAEVLRGAFHDEPLLKGYVLDDQDRVRQHVMIFVNGQVIRDRKGLTDPVGDGDEVFVMQALSGG